MTQTWWHPSERLVGVDPGPRLGKGKWGTHLGCIIYRSNQHLKNQDKWCFNMAKSQTSCKNLWWTKYHNFFLIFYFTFERETEHEQRRGRESGRHGIWSRLQVLSCQPRTHEPWDHDWAEVGRLIDWATQVPQNIVILNEDKIQTCDFHDSASLTLP